MVQLTVPDLGEGIDKAQVVVWHAGEGDRVRQDDDIVELVTDKAVFQVPAPADGILTAIKVRTGEDVAIGGVLGIID